MSIQVFLVLRSPAYALTAFAIAAVFGTTLLYFNEFLFFAPYLTLFVPPEGVGMLLLDLAISASSGITIVISFFQISRFPRLPKTHGRTGMAGILLAIFAGACPCYYLVPLLAVAGGAGGALAAVGILFNAYQFPIKLLSLALLVPVTYSLERSLKASCRIQEPTKMINVG